ARADDARRGGGRRGRPRQARRGDSRDRRSGRRLGDRCRRRRLRRVDEHGARAAASPARRARERRRDVSTPARGGPRRARRRTLRRVRARSPARSRGYPGSIPNEPTAVSKETLGTRAFDDPPAVAAWRHCGARDGFEVVFATSSTHGWRFEGSTAAIEGGCAWQVGYTIEVDRGWSTLSVHLVGRSLGCGREVAIERGADGTWHVNGRPAPALDGCTDVDLESSVLTNTFPVR